MELTAGGVIAACVILIGTVLAWRQIKRSGLNAFLDKRGVGLEHRKRIFKNIRYVILLLGLLGIVMSLGLNRQLFEHRSFSFTVASIINILLIIQVARVLEVFMQYLQRSKDTAPIGAGLPAYEAITKQQKKKQRLGTKTIQYMVVVFFLYLFVTSFDLDYVFFTVGEKAEVTISSLLVFVLILLIARFIYWIFSQIILAQYFRVNKEDAGTQYAISQLAKYVIYVIGIYTALMSIGINPTLIWGGLAALLVGVGLGLQQTFNDLFSGIMLLTERSIEVGDFVQAEGLIGAVKHIGLRTSIIETRDNITVIVPNSKMVTENVINWSHFEDQARFTISVGVAYGSDTAKVKDILKQVASDHKEVVKRPAPVVFFQEFGDSSLNFDLLFWCRDFWNIERIKSELRFEVDRAFREHNIVIPFPQRDVWIRKTDQL